MNAPYLYDGLEAAFYDRLDELSDLDDVGFYQWFAEANGGPVLDVGCGTGRVLIPLLEAGLSGVGIDASPQMAARARSALRERGLCGQIFESDMRDFDVGLGQYGFVIIPGYSWQLLVDDGDLLRCLQRCRNHLRPGGQLVLPSFQPWEMIWAEGDEQPLELRRSCEDPDRQERLSAWQGWTRFAREQRLELRNVYERSTLAGAVIEREERRMLMRWDAPHDTMRLLESLGFSDIGLYGDYGFEPPEPDSETVVFVASASE